MIEYRKMTEENINDVVAKYVAYYNNAEGGCWTTGKAYTRIHQVMTTENALCFLQYENLELVGFLMGYYKEFDDLTTFYIEEIVIFDGYQNKGYGTELVKKLKSEITAAGATHIELASVNDAHHMHFYEKLGFHKASNLVLMAQHFD